MLLNDLRQNLQTVFHQLDLSGIPSIRCCDDDEFLFSSNIIGMAEPEDIGKLYQLLEENGWNYKRLNDLLLLDHEVPVPVNFSKSVINRDDELARCISILQRHDCVLPCDKKIIRKLAKAETVSKQRLDDYCFALHRQLAEDLRKKVALPEGLLQYLVAVAGDNERLVSK